jgi:hypothetical protein
LTNVLNTSLNIPERYVALALAAVQAVRKRASALLRAELP